MDKRKAKHTLIIKLVCVLLSFGLWIYVTNVENTIRTYTLKGVPVKVLNVETLKNYGLALSPNQDFTVDLNLEGDAKYIYSVTKEQFSLTADLGEYALKDGVNNIPVQVVNYPEEINLKNNGNLFIKVKLEKLITKEFNTTSAVKISYAQGVFKQKENFTSQKVEVSGPQSAVNRVETVALVGELNDVKGNIEKEFPLQPLDSEGRVVQGVSLSLDRGLFTIGVNNGKNVSVSADFKGEVSNGYKLDSTTLSRQSVEIIGDKNIIDKIDSLKTESIDLSTITSNTDRKVKLILPEGVTVVDGNPYINVNIVVSNSKEVEENNLVNKTFDINVKYVGLNDDLNLLNETNKITVTIEGKKDDLDKVNTKDFQCVVDLSKYKNEGDYTSDPKVTLSNGDNIKIKNIPSVKFTLKQKDTPADKDNSEEKKPV